MANTKISGLPAATSVAGADLIPVVQGGVTKQATVSLLPSGAAMPSRNPHPQAQNLKGWTWDPMIAGAGNSGAGVDTLYLGKILVPEAVPLSNVLFVTGLTPTTDSVGFYAVIVLPDGTVVRVSADLAATVNATPASTLVTAALSSPVTVGGGGVTDFVYAGFGFDSAVTLPSFLTMAGNAANNAAVNAGLPVGARRHGTLANAVWPPVGPLALGSMVQAGTAKNFWIGVS